MRHRIAAKLLLVVVGCAVAVCGLEAALRIHGYQAFRWSDRINPEILELTDNPDLPYVLEPNAEGRGWDTDIKINANGFRDREYAVEKGPHFRIAAIGDSITFGSGISSTSELYPKRLERALLRRAPDLRPQVLNFGVTGYDVLNNVEYLRTHALKFQPDVVVMGFCVNDIGSASTADEYVRAQRYLEHPVFRLRSAQWFLSLGLRAVASVRVRLDGTAEQFEVRNRNRILPTRDDPVLAAQMAALPSPGEMDAEEGLLRWWTEPARLGYLEYAFTRLRDLSARHHFAVVVVGLPILRDSERAPWRVVNEMIRHESLKFGFHFVDVFDWFERRGPEHLRNRPDDDIHPNAEGHAIVARALDDYLATSLLLSDQRTAR